MSRLCLITALPAESRPLLDELKLRQVASPHLRLYGSEEYLLLETGVGKLNAAAATGAVLTAHSDICAVLNIGIAGGSFDYAQTVVASHVRDEATGAQWFPHLPSAAAFRSVTSARIDTRDTVGTHYQQGVLFDMEASGIFSAASRYLSSSQIHSVKVVSDNAQHNAEAISKESVIQIIHQSLSNIVPMLDVLREQGTKHMPVGQDIAEQTVQQALDATHHSVNDEHQLRQLVLQHIALTGKQPTLDTRCGSAAKIRRSLQLAINEQPFVYGVN